MVAVVLFCTFEGAGRKWVIPNSSPAEQGLFYFSKDLPLILAVLIGLRCRPRAPIFGPARQVLTLGAVFLFAGTLMSVDGISPIGAVVSIRGLVLLPWAAMIVGPALVGRNDLTAVLTAAGVCVGVNAVLGALQFFSPPGDILNRQVTDAQSAIGDIGRVRASGTYAFLSGMASLCAFACWAGSVLILRSPGRPWGYVFVAGGFVVTSEAMSRGGFTNAAVIVGLSLMSTSAGRVVGLLAVGAGAAAMVLMPESEPTAVDEPGITQALTTRHKATGEGAWARILDTWMQVPEAIAYDPIGCGLGQTQTGGQVVATGKAGWIFEFELARIVFEVGLIGLLGTVAIRVGVPLVFYHHTPRLLRPRVSEWHAVWWPTVWYTALMLPMHLAYDHVAVTYLCVAMICGYAAAEQGSRP